MYICSNFTIREIFTEDRGAKHVYSFYNYAMRLRNRKAFLGYLATRNIARHKDDWCGKTKNGKFAAVAWG